MIATMGNRQRSRTCSLLVRIVRRAPAFRLGLFGPRQCLAVLALAFAGQSARAGAAHAPAVRCETAIGAAARASHVPADLMAAIGLVETGRQDPVSGAWHPWPWSINAEGKGLFFTSKSEAIAAVRSLQADGVRSIDVGCMQVNLMHHPDAFATLEEAFDPIRNANYAGRFLDQLFQRSGHWMVAAGWYHSGTSDLAADYVKKVLAILPRGRQSLVTARGLSLSINWNDAAPVVGRDGMVLPSVRLTPKGLVPGRPADRYLGSRGKPGVRFAG
jgi:Transglycosylase SLT domain